MRSGRWSSGSVERCPGGCSARESVSLSIVQNGGSRSTARDFSATELYTGRMRIDELLRALIACNSISSVNAELDQGNRAVVDLLANWAADLGFRVEIQPLADPRKANLIATLGQGPGGLVLAGHADTVPCNPELWRSDPFVLETDEQHYRGLGVCDMKGFFALALAAAKGFASRRLREPLILLATADEETSMAGAQALVEAGRPRARAALIGEPTGMKPVAAHKGILVEKLRISGRSGHSSDPERGANALHTLHRALGALRELAQDLGNRGRDPRFVVDHATLNLGCARAGDNPNRICGHADLGFEIRPLPGVDLGALREELEALLLPLGEADGTGVEIDHLIVPPFEAPEDSPLVAVCEELTGYRREAVAFATEAPYLHQLGLDVTVLGPGDIDQAHQPDESLPRARVQPMVELLEALIARRCLGPV